jgi:hypothetical protein
MYRQNQGVRCSHHLKSSGLPLNPLECGMDSTSARKDDLIPHLCGGTPHGTCRKQHIEAHTV